MTFLTHATRAEDLMGVVSLFASLNRLLDGLGIVRSTEGHTLVGAMVAEQGYRPVIQMIQNKAAAPFVAAFSEKA